ncbi:uncharacterized protein LOC143268061 [Peromyscus maniculatus bairdii]|uniref:uncharacterized protein LOC143268061 n=1 Tax=Peromyscus maniculatus bairdii TaxID=230844 RepID=UPI003FD5E0C4
MGNCCSRVTPEHQVATPSSTDVQKSPSSLTKMEPGKDRWGEYNLLEKNHQQQHMVAPEKTEIPQVQADTSGHVPSTESEVSPEPTTSAASPRYKKHRPVKTVRAKTKKHRCVSRIKRRLFGKGKISPKDAEVPEVQADTSGHVPSTEREVSPEPTTSAASPHYEQHRPVKTVRAKTKKHRCVSRIKRRLFGKGKISPKDAEVPEVQADTSGHVPSTEREVSPEPTTSAASPHYKQHRPVTTVRVMTIRHKCVLKKRTIKTTVIPLDTDGPQIMSGTSKETYIKTEEIHENSTTFSSRKQGELPVMMVEVESRKHTSLTENDDTLRPDGRTEENPLEVRCRSQRRISPLLKRIQQREAIPHTDVMTPEICKFYSIEIPNEKVLKKRTIKTTVIPLDTDGPQIISGTSKETYIKTEEIHENSTTFSSRKQGELPVMMVEVESRKHTSLTENDDTLRPDGRTEENPLEVRCRSQRRISPLLKRIQQREAIPHTDVMTPEICKFYSIEIPNEKVILENDENTLRRDGRTMTEENSSEVNCRNRRRVIPENDENTLRRDGRTMTEENSSEVHCRNRRRMLPEETEIKVEKVEKRKFNCFTSFFRRFCKKKTIIPQVMEEPPATPVVVPGSGSTSDKIIQTQEEDTEDAPDIKQLFSKEEEIDHSTEGAWEEDQSDLSGAISVPESRQMLQITSVVFGNRDAPELQLRELGKESSPIALEINVLYQAPPKTSNEDTNEEEEEEEEEEVVVEEPVEEFTTEEEAATDEEAETEEEVAPKAEAGEAEEEEEEEVVELEAAGEEAEEEKEEEEEEEGGMKSYYQ